MQREIGGNDMTNHNLNIGVTGQYVTKGVPTGYTSLTPFIVVSDPKEAIAFYEHVFGAKMKSVTEVGSEDNKMIIHAELDMGNGYLQLGAVNAAYGLVTPPAEGNACYSLGLYVHDVETVIARALASGATSREEITSFVSGDRYGSILDPYGIRWSIMSRVEDISVEESFRRVEEWSKGI